MSILLNLTPQPQGSTRIVEAVEAAFPIRVEEYALVEDSGGVGINKGGADGRCSSYRVVRHDGTEQRIPSKTLAQHLEEGDSLIIETAGGGGWGNPNEISKIEGTNDV